MLTTNERFWEDYYWVIIDVNRLNPEQEQYKTILATMKRQAEQEKDDKATNN